MACRTVLRSMLLAEQWRPPSSGAGLSCSTAAATTAALQFPRRLTPRRRRSSPRGAPLRCSLGETNPSFSSSSSSGDQDPPQEAVLKAISEVSKWEGRVAQTTNVVIGGTVTDDSTNEWLALDQKSGTDEKIAHKSFPGDDIQASSLDVKGIFPLDRVNSYPTVRGFTAIGTGGDDFVQSMVVAVESVLQRTIPEGHINSKLSSRGKYVSVNIGPIQVVSSEQVQAIYNAMRRDDRMKYFL